MSLVDFLKRNKKKRRSGRQSATPEHRTSDQHTKQLPLDAMGQPSHQPAAPHQPPHPAHPPLPQNTIRFRSISNPPAAPVDHRTALRLMPQIQPDPQQPVRPPENAPQQYPDHGQTQYVTSPGPSGGDIVGVLVAIDGDLKGQIFRVVDGENRMGRSGNCQIELNSQKISRSHALLIHQAGTFLIKPLSDKNPTFLNDGRVEGTLMSDGDTLRLGLTVFKFRSI